MWQQQMLIEGLSMNVSKVPTKKIFSVYIDTELIDTIKQEAIRQSRKISAQTEVFLRAATKKTGDTT